MVPVSKEKIIRIGQKDVSVKGDRLFITYRSKVYAVPFKEISKVLNAATQAQRENFTISPSGYGLHWPDVDEDLAVGSLLRDMKVL